MVLKSSRSNTWASIAPVGKAFPSVITLLSRVNVMLWVMSCMSPDCQLNLFTLLIVSEPSCKRIGTIGEQDGAVKLEPTCGYWATICTENLIRCSACPTIVSLLITQ